MQVCLAAAKQCYSFQGTLTKIIDGQQWEAGVPNACLGVSINRLRFAIAMFGKTVATLNSIALGGHGRQ
jgi:hypothetical protein